MDTIQLDTEQRQQIAVKVCRMQRELAGIVERLYQNEVPFDDAMQALAVRALDDMFRLQLCVRAIDLGAFPMEGDGA